MAKKLTGKSLTSPQAWGLDQLAKSDFFHQKLHEWKLIEVAKQIERLRGETFIWNQALLGITETAWNKIIHRGIKPIVVFAHPDVLQNIKGATAYYRMLAMVSQKSMSQISGAVIAYDTGLKQPDRETAEWLTAHFNRIISHLIETDEKIDRREFDIWRGMAAGSQAQGSWQNAKGEQVEALFRGMIERQVRDSNLATSITDKEILLKDGRTLIFSSEPDLAIFNDKNVIQLAVEIKGGIDTAAVLERIGAAIKSLKRAKEVNPNAITVLIMQEVAFSVQAKRDIELNKETINHLFMLERLMENKEEREVFFRVLKI